MQLMNVVIKKEKPVTLKIEMKEGRIPDGESEVRTPVSSSDIPSSLYIQANCPSLTTAREVVNKLVQ